MFPNRCMYNTAIEEDLGSVCDCIEHCEGFFEFLVVIMAKGFNPCLDFLYNP